MNQTSLMIKFFLVACLILCSMPVFSKDIVFRSLQSSDWEKFRALRLSALEECPKAYGIALADELHYSDQYWQDLCSDAGTGQGKWYQVAESPEGELIGMIGAVDLCGSLMQHQVEIVQAYVAPLYRRKHIMEQLFVALRNELRNVSRLEQMIVWVTLHETQTGCEMFKKFGFVYAGKLSKTVKYGDRYYDCCWLEASLN